MADPTANESEFQRFMRGLEKRNPGETEFHQAVYEFAEAVIAFLDANPHYREASGLSANRAARRPPLPCAGSPS